MTWTVGDELKRRQEQVDFYMEQLAGHIPMLEYTLRCLGEIIAPLRKRNPNEPLKGPIINDLT